MLERMTSAIASIILLSSCIQKTHYIPSKSFYAEGESFTQTCLIAKNKLGVYLPEVCQQFNAAENSFSCNETTIQYHQIKRLIFTDNDVGEDALYISTGNEEYVISKERTEKNLKEITDALEILRQCNR